MKILIVFDSFLGAGKIDLSSFKQVDTVYLFSLTSQVAISMVLEERLKEVGCEVRKIMTAAMINAAAEELRDPYMRFISRLPGRIRKKQKNLKGLFALDEYATLWWFSLISEKSTLKSNAFNALSQLHSIIQSVNDGEIEKIVFWCRNKNLKDALFEYASEHFIRFRVLPDGPLDSLRQYILGRQIVSYLRHILLMLNFAIKFLWRTCKIKKVLDRSIPAISSYDAGLLIITPYPNFDMPSAQKGVFKNKYYPFLQEALEGSGKKITWMAMYIYSDSILFGESLKYTKQFIKSGCSLFFLEEFNSIRTHIRTFLAMLKSGLKFISIEDSISAAHTFGNYNFYNLLKDDWYSSFAGATGYSGLLYYNMFKSMFDRFKIEKCLYFYEMQTWEKALICAKEATRCVTSLYGYQAGTISRMLLNLFNDPSEMIDHTSYALPRPDKLICSGPLPYRYMRESGWPEQDLLVAEAIRYSYLKKFLRKRWRKEKDVILLAFSISLEESTSFLNIAYEAFKDLKDAEIWIKPHPFLDLKRVFEFSGISEENSIFKIKKGPIEDFLPEARIVIVGESGVTIEALAFGCEIVVMSVPECINMSLLRYVKTDIVKTVASAEELRQTVINKFKEEYKPEMYEMEYRRIIDDFFYLNYDSDIPTRFLDFLNGKDSRQGNEHIDVYLDRASSAATHSI